MTFHGGAPQPKTHRLQTLRLGQIARICAAACRPMLLATAVRLQGAVGFRVTLKCRILRRSWSMMKKQYRTPNVSVGTVKKSIAAMASRWFLRNVSQRFTRSASFGARRIHRETLLIETQLEQFAVNTRCSPGGILGNIRKIARTSLLTRFRPPTCLTLETPCPIQTKPRPMPVHDGSRGDQDERFPPPGPARPQHNSEQLVQGSQSAARLLRVQSQQLTKSQIFKDEVLSGPESADHPLEEMPERRDHVRIVSEKPKSSFAPSHSFCGFTTIWREHKVLLLPFGSASYGQYALTVRDDTRIPSFTNSSSAIRSSPQLGFPRTILPINWRGRVNPRSSHPRLQTTTTT